MSRSPQEHEVKTAARGTCTKFRPPHTLMSGSTGQLDGTRRPPFRSGPMVKAPGGSCRRLIQEDLARCDEDPSRGDNRIAEDPSGALPIPIVRSRCPFAAR